MLENCGICSKGEMGTGSGQCKNVWQYIEHKKSLQTENYPNITSSHFGPGS
jgi:hypothetical protein